ncbi:MAG: hypothetical protein M0Q12_02685 [Synergistaceae bacterium]|nr:hypothetical protein [Synergistaceae bacterium]
MSRNEEMKQRVLMWEKEHNRTLESLTRDEWIEAIRTIMALTRYEAEELLTYFQTRLPELKNETPTTTETKEA